MYFKQLPALQQFVISKLFRCLFHPYWATVCKTISLYFFWSLMKKQLHTKQHLCRSEDLLITIKDFLQLTARQLLCRSYDVWASCWCLSRVCDNRSECHTRLSTSEQFQGYILGMRSILELLRFALLGSIVLPVRNIFLIRLLIFVELFI